MRELKLPGQLEAEFTLKGLWLAAIALMVALLLGGIVVQTVRLEGFKFWPLSIEGALPKAARLAKAVKERDRIIEQIKVAQRAAELAQRQVNDAAEQSYSTIAKRIDDNAQDDLARQLAAADAYVAAYRVRSEAAGGALGRAAAGAGDHRAGDSQAIGRSAQLDDTGGAPAGPGADGGLVVVAAEDVRICTVNTIKAEAGHQLATELEAASAAPPK